MAILRIPTCQKSRESQRNITTHPDRRGRSSLLVIPVPSNGNVTNRETEEVLEERNMLHKVAATVQ